MLTYWVNYAIIYFQSSNILLINSKGKKMDQTVKNMFKSLAMKERNADKARLNPNARAIYLAGIAGLKHCEEVANTYHIRSVVVPMPEKVLAK